MSDDLIEAAADKFLREWTDVDFGRPSIHNIREALIELVKFQGVSKDAFMAEIERQAAEEATADSGFRVFQIRREDPEDPESLCVVCPWCSTINEVVEVDKALRWNELNPPVMVDGSEDEPIYQATASTDNNGDYDNDGFLCRHCMSDKILQPDNYEITEWY